MRTQKKEKVLFEIKIAVFGYVSAGKSTFINALLRDKYTEVSMGRTTAGVNYFSLSVRKGKKRKKQADTNDSMTEVVVVHDSTTSSFDNEKSSSDDKEHNIISESSFQECGSSSDEQEQENNYQRRSAASTLEEITKDNAAFRESNKIHVKHFDIEMEEPLCEMRDDTKLVLVDIPGINEAGAGGKYRTYVTKKWDTFDCAIVVMDGRQGANTEEQVNLLKFVQKNNAEKKDIPTIILCNKVDDPYDEEQGELVKEARMEVERIFKAPNRQKALDEILNSSASNKKSKSSTDSQKPKSSSPQFPIFIPTSAVLAYIYRTATLMTLEQFQKFDKNLIEMLGRKEVGWKWQKMTQEQKFRVAHEAVRDQSLYQERIAATNFDQVLKVLAFTVGGVNVQLQLIQKQIDVALKSLDQGKDIAAQIRSIYEKRKGLGQSVEDIKAAFWKTYDGCENSAFCLLSASPSQVAVLAPPVKELVDYYKFANSKGWKDQQDIALVRMKEMVRRQFELILEKESVAKSDWVTRKAPDNSIDWDSLHPLDWMGICQSFLLLSYDKQFCECFGREKMVLQNLVSKWRMEMQSPPDFGDCNKCLKTKLDFNYFCATCKTFFTPEGCDGLFFRLACACPKCGKISGSTSASRQLLHCCGHNYYTHNLPFQYNTSPSLQPPSLQLLCYGCSGPLTLNRGCDSCNIFFCVKGSNRATGACVCCGASNSQNSRGISFKEKGKKKKVATVQEKSEGSCASCSRKLFVWQEIPSFAMDELFSLKYDKKDGTLQPNHPETYKSVVRLDVPQSLSNPNHYGHVAWLFCEFMAELDK